MNSSSSRVTPRIFFNECMKGPFYMHKSWVGDRTIRVEHNTVRNDYIVDILLQICVLFLYQLYLNCNYTLVCNLT